jgi:multicomponent Na+:H+ antiporter subunit D
MPWTMGAFTIGALGLAGVPPINGFISKWFLCMGSLEADKLIILFIFVISGLLNAVYFFPIVHRAFFKPGGKDLEKHGEASMVMVIPLCITAVLSLALGLYPNLFFNMFDLAQGITQSVMNIYPEVLFTDKSL